MMSLIHAASRSGRTTRCFVARVFCSLFLSFFIGTGLASAQTNSWIASGDGKWETGTNWSAGQPSVLDSLLLITNAGSKIITVDAVTARSFQGTLSVSNLTISAPVFALNALYLDNAGSTGLLQVLQTLTIGDGGEVVVSGSSLTADSLDNQGLIEADGGTVTLSTGGVLNSGSVVVTNGGALVLAGQTDWFLALPVAYGGGSSGGSIISSNSGGVVFLENPAYQQNDGTLQVLGGNDINYGLIGSDLVNNGVIAGNGSLTGNYGNYNYGIMNRATISSTSGGTLTLDPRDAFDYGGVENAVGATMIVAGNSTLVIRRTDNAWYNASAVFPSNWGELLLQGGTLLGEDTNLANGANGVASTYVNNSPGLIEGCGSIENFTTLLNNGTILADCGSSLNFGGAVTNAGSLIVTNGTRVNFYGPVVNNGLIDAADGYVRFFSTFQNNGTLLTNPPPTAANFTVLHTFSGGADGGTPDARLTQGPDGNFYGSTFNGGIVTSGCPNGCGTLFRIGPSVSFSSFYQFSGLDGANPYAWLTQGSDGQLYGTTTDGGTNGLGTMFKISLGGEFTLLYSLVYGQNGDGHNPFTALLEVTNGVFYGTTQSSRFYANESLFYTISDGVYYGGIQICGFGGSDCRGNAHGSLVQDPDGNLYGTTLAPDTVYQLVPPYGDTTNYIVLYTFSEGLDGAEPEAGLAAGNDGWYYGTTYGGGTNGLGTLFKVSSSGTFASLHSFTGGADGAYPIAGLTLGSDGNFYGTTSAGGSFTAGTIFSITPDGTLTVVHEFDGSAEGNPVAGLIQGIDGNFYGTTVNGGPNQAGLVFQLRVPLNPPANQINQIQLSSTNVVITVPSVFPEAYQLQSSASLATGAWSNVPGASVTNCIGGSLTLTNFGGASLTQQFYRLAITP